MSAGFGLSPVAELSEETLINDCADSAEVSEEPPALKKRNVLTKPNDSAAKGTIHPSSFQIYQLLAVEALQAVTSF